MSQQPTYTFSGSRVLAAIALIVMVVLLVLYFVSSVDKTKLVVLFLFTWGLWMVLSVLVP